MPHKRTLQSITTAQNVSVDKIEAKSYLKTATSNFSQLEKVVNIQIYEIYVNTIVQYR